jgi:extradiol dioxygenase family protein
MTQHAATADYPRFHLAFPVTDLARARDFYGRYLGCAEGRSSDAWVDFDFFGHQIVAHKVASAQMSDATVDPFGNALEFKAFADPDRLFAK